MTKNLFSKDDRKRIIDAIMMAEKETSGEIQVHLEGRCKTEVLDRAAQVFKTLRMQKTEQRNGVLFYLAVEDRKLAILGDSGINERVASDFWDDVRNAMLESFKAERFTEGLCTGIGMAGQQLKEYFPYQQGDKNELPDEISFG